jgi:excisionase family DNA binding protein
MAVAEPKKPVVYSIAETAKELGTGLNQTYAAVHKGQIPSVKIGHRYYVPARFFRQLEGSDQETA